MTPAASIAASLFTLDLRTAMATKKIHSVLVTAKIESLEDLYGVERGGMSANQVRRVEVTDAVINTAATMLSMPKRLIARLGLRHIRKQQALTSASAMTIHVYGTVRLTIMERDCIADVAEVPDDCPMQIDRITLHLLDFVVDPVSHRLIGDPAHGGEPMLDLF